MDQILSVCTGIGGLDLGLHAGLRVVGRVPRAVGYVEREAFAVSCLGKAIEEGRLDDAPVWCGDLRIMPVDLLPRIDWICGGYPCQPFSTAGKRQGRDDHRHLWPDIRELVSELRPAGVLLENVSGHVSLGLFDVLSDLEGCGYRTAWGCYSASSVGAPHRRKRVFILGLADTDGGRLAGVGQRDGESQARREVQQRDDVDGCGEDVAYCNGERLEGRRRFCVRTHQWPTGQGCPQRPDEPARCVESRLGRNADGLPDRVDRLRALGNAVVPQQAEMAFLDLWRQLH